MEKLTRITFCLLIATLHGCKVGGDNAAFTVSPSQLTFTGELGAAAPASKILLIKPNKQDSVFPSISATGDAIVTTASASCVGLSTSNLACRQDSASTSVIITVPVPAPHQLTAGTHAGSIVIASGQHSVTVPVTYTVTPGPATVQQITPRPVIAGLKGTATIRGSGFARFGTTPPEVSFGTLAATSVTVVNDSTLSVGYPPLPAGTYEVNLTGATTPFPSTAQLVVTPPHTYAKAGIPSTGAKLGILYDAVREAVYVAKTDLIERYDATGAGWSATPVSGSVPGLGAIVYSADGKLIAAGKNKFHQLDPDTLAETGATDATTTGFGLVECWYAPCFDSAAMTSAGDVVAVASTQWQKMYFYHVADSAITTSVDHFGNTNGSLYTPSLTGSAQGNRILAMHSGSPLLYDTVQDTLTTITAPLGAKPSLNADGTVIVSDTEILKDSGEGYVSYATLPQQPDALVSSPDGNTVYAYFATGNYVRPYDISTLATVSPGLDIPLAGTPSGNIVMTIAPDAKTVFIAGDNTIEVVPVR